ncbi:MAG: hypothetical protein HQK83_13890 [Fibrobacteria bacterium]|nr:hypothetical protein [Fibrobacteria bacterium]
MLITAGLLFLCPLMSTAQEETLSLQESERKGSHEKKISHYHEVLSKDVLSKYYDERTFLVDAQATLVNVNGKRSQILDDYSIKALPGLPILPDELRSDAPASNSEAGSYQPEFTIKNLAIEVLVDTSYNDKDLAFISKLISMAANLNEYRGDRLTIRKGVFPVKKNAGSNYGIDSAQPLSEKEELKEVMPSNPFQAYIDNLASLIPLMIICLFVLLIVWLITKAISGKKGKDSEAYTSILQEINQLKNNLSPEAPKEASAEENELSDLKSYVLSSFIGNPKHSSQVIQNWIKEDNTKGLEASAGLIKTVDERLINVILPELSKELASRLVSSIKNAGTIESPITLLKEFQTGFKNETTFMADDSIYKDMFGFLQQLNEQQILHLIKEESEGITGMVLAQLKPDVAGTILQKIDKSKRIKILAGMGKIENIPLGVYQKLADKLSAKAIEVIKMKYVAADGIESVLELLDNLPMNVQEEYLNSLAETDLHLAEKIKASFVTMAEIPDLPDKFLGSVVRTMDQDTIIKTLVNAEDNLKTKVLGLLPERMQLMIQSGLETMTDVPADETDASEKKFLQVIRQEIKAAGGRPE